MAFRAWSLLSQVSLIDVFLVRESVRVSLSTISGFDGVSLWSLVEGCLESWVELYSVRTLRESSGACSYRRITRGKAFTTHTYRSRNSLKLSSQILFIFDRISCSQWPIILILPLTLRWLRSALWSCFLSKLNLSRSRIFPWQALSGCQSLPERASPSGADTLLLFISREIWKSAIRHYDVILVSVCIFDFRLLMLGYHVSHA